MQRRDRGEEFRRVFRASIRASAAWIGLSPSALMAALFMQDSK